MATAAKNNGGGRELMETLADIKAVLATVTTRIGANEQDAQRLARDQHLLGQTVERGFAELRQTLGEHNKTPWGVIFSGFSITLAVAVTIGGLAMFPLREKDAVIQESVRALRADAREQFRDMMPRGEIEARIHALEARLPVAGK